MARPSYASIGPYVLKIARRRCSTCWRWYAIVSASACRFASSYTPRGPIGLTGTPVRLGCGCTWIAVPRSSTPGEPCPRHLASPRRGASHVGAGLERVERHAQVVHRARERGEVVHEVDGLVARDRRDDVVVDERERLVAQVVDVLQRRHDEVVDADHAVVALEQRLAEVEPRKPAPPVTSEVGMSRC